MGFFCSIYRTLALTAAVAAFNRMNTHTHSTILKAAPHASTITASVDARVMHDVWIVGAGTLGQQILQQLKERNPNLSVVAETATTSRHAFIRQLNCTPKLRNDRSRNDMGMARNVIITLPPSSVSNYSAELEEACSLWSGCDFGGKIIFTSSTAVYGEPIGHIMPLNEDSPRIHHSERASTYVYM
jgi:hypothetical protein